MEKFSKNLEENDKKTIAKLEVAGRTDPEGRTELLGVSGGGREAAAPWKSPTNVPKAKKG